MSASNGIPVILNCRAGGQAVNDMTERLSVLFKEAKLPAALIVAGEHQDLSRVVQRALAARPAMIVAAGGDGTINAVASEVVGTDTILGVLPMGTLNHFARDLHIPTGLSEAIATLGSGTTARIDVGEVNGRIFLNNSASASIRASSIIASSSRCAWAAGNGARSYGRRCCCSATIPC